MADTVKIQGLKEMNKALRNLDKGAPKATRIALNGAGDFLIGKTRPLIPSRTGTARRSLKAASTRTEVRISVGGKVAPYYPWLDFGGRTGRKRSVRRPFIKEGRYLYPTLRKNRDQFTKILQGSLEKVAHDAGLDVN